MDIIYFQKYHTQEYHSWLSYSQECEIISWNKCDLNINFHPFILSKHAPYKQAERFFKEFDFLCFNDVRYTCYRSLLLDRQG